MHVVHPHQTLSVNTSAKRRRTVAPDVAAYLSVPKPVNPKQVPRSFEQKMKGARLLEPNIAFLEVFFPRRSAQIIIEREENTT